MTAQHHGLLPFRGIHHLCTIGDFRPGRFARLCSDLPPLYIDPLTLHKIGEKDGVMADTAPALTKDVPAGLIFFGQFIDHDITFDNSSSLTSTNSPSGTENVRTPTLDLDAVYLDGPGGSPFLYNSERDKAGNPIEPGRLLTGEDYASRGRRRGFQKQDLPRTPHNTAIIGDPRNDENRIISQMHLGFLHFHNAIIKTGKNFAEARRLATWHYQWIVVNEFLLTICGNWIVDDILANGRKLYRPEKMGIKEPFIPIEFATAAFRFGHTLIPQKLRTKPGGPQHDIFGEKLGNGFRPVESEDEVVDWAALLDSGNGQYDRAGRVDTLLAPMLLDLPFLAGAPAFERSLAVRNLLRAQSFLIPSGEQIAQAMIEAGASEITSQMISDVRADAANRLGLPKATPLWLYMLAEGSIVGRMDTNEKGEKTFAKGEGLGPVGARLVAEVIIGLLELDERSYLGSNRSWSPHDTADKIGAGVTTLYQLLTT
jgi:hypothetical protein